MLPVKRFAACLIVASLVCNNGIAEEVCSSATDERLSRTLKTERKNLSIEETKRSLGLRDSATRSFSIGDWDVDYGGSFLSTYRYYRDIDNRDTLPDFLRSSWQQEAYLWFDAVLNENLNAYVMVSDTYIQRDVGPTYDGIGDDHGGPKLDQAYLRWHSPLGDDLQSSLTVGRQYLYMGRGISFSDVQDGVKWEFGNSEWTQQYILSTTLPHADNVDLSVPGFDKNGERIFLGGEFKYTAIPNMVLYGYGIGQWDLANESPSDPKQDYSYDSYYVGGGLEQALNPSWTWWTEAIFEGGHGYNDISSLPSTAQDEALQRTDVNAWAYVVGTKYRWDITMHPVLELESAHGSGDKDRFFVTDTNGGDLNGNDQGFIGFGNYQAGYALQPLLSNLYISHVGVSFQPFESHPTMGPFAIGGKYYYYRKDQNAGGTSDFQSDETDPDVGQEIDIYIHWKIREDTTLSVKYGLFFPGEAFDSNEQNKTRYFFSRISYDF